MNVLTLFHKSEIRFGLRRLNWSP